MEEIFTQDNPQRDQELFRMFQILRESSLNHHAPKTENVKPQCALFALEQLFTTRLSAPDGATLKAFVINALLPDGVDISSLSSFETVSFYEQRCKEPIMDFEAFAAAFDDVPLARGTALALNAALIRLRQLESAINRIADEEARGRKYIADDEFENREELASSYRRSRDIAMLRDQINAAGLRYRREARIQEMLNGTFGQESEDSVSTANLRTEAAQTKAKSDAYLRAATHFEEVSGVAEEDIKAAGSQLVLLRKWATTALQLARQQVEESLADVVEAVNSRRPPIDERLSQLEDRLADVTEAIYAAAAKTNPEALRSFTKSRDPHVTKLREDVRGNWRIAAAYSLDSPQLPLCDPANVNVDEMDSLSQHLTATLTWIFDSYASVSVIMNGTEVKLMPTDEFERFATDHVIPVPGGASLCVAEFGAQGHLDFNALVCVMNHLAQLIHGHRCARFSLPFALHCIVQSAVECRQARLVVDQLTRAKPTVAFDALLAARDKHAQAFSSLERLLLNGSLQRSSAFDDVKAQCNAFTTKPETTTTLFHCVETLKYLVTETLISNGAPTGLGPVHLTVLCQHALTIAIAAAAFQVFGGSKTFVVSLFGGTLGPSPPNLRSISLPLGVAMVAFVQILTADPLRVPSIAGQAVPLLAVPWASPHLVLQTLARLVN